MEIKKGTKLKLKWQFLNEGEPVSLSDFSKFRLDVLDVRSVPQRTSVALSENEAVFTIDTAKYETGRFSVRVDADGPDGGLHICHRNAFRIVPANAKSSLAKGGPGENYELTIQDDLSGQTQSVVEEQDPTVPDHVKAITQQNITDWGKKVVFLPANPSYNQVNEVYSNGQLPVIVRNAQIFTLSEKIFQYPYDIYKFSHYSDGRLTLLKIYDNGLCMSEELEVECSSRKKSSWSTDPNDDNYPSEKLVFESLASKQNKLPSLEGNAGKVLRIKSDETGVEWVSID